MSKAIILKLIVIIMVGMCLLYAENTPTFGDNKTDKSKLSLESSPTTASQTAEPAGPEIPPEVLEQILRLSPRSEAMGSSLPKLSTQKRLLLGAWAVGIVIIGLVICRLLSRQNKQFGSVNGVFLLLGVFGGIAGEVLAAACIGSLYLHLGAAICTFISGFCIAVLLVSQFDWPGSLIQKPATVVLSDSSESIPLQMENNHD